MVIGVSSLLSFSDRLKAKLTPMRGEKREEEEGGRGGHYGLTGGDMSLPSSPPHWGARTRWREIGHSVVKKCQNALTSRWRAPKFLDKKQE